MRVNDYIKRQGQTGVDVITLDERQLNRLKAAELEIADDVVAYCAAHDIMWTLGGGSALGAARHGGFIPWDDDIDFNMPREDWERFRDGFPRECGDKYELISPETDPTWEYNAIKVFKRGTSLRELSVPEGEGRGIFVDIFPFEAAPDNPALRCLHGVLCEALRYINSCVRLRGQREHIERVFAGNGEAMSGYRFRFAVGWLFSFSSAAKWAQRSDAACKMCAGLRSRCVTCPTGARRYFGELRPRDELFPPATLEFEGRRWNVPCECDAYLTKLYGSWREVPQEGEREQHVLLELDFGDGERGR